MNQYIIKLAGITLLITTILGCKSNGENERSNNTPVTMLSCDSVTWLGVSFMFPKGFRIDSVSCIRNNKTYISSDLFNEKRPNEVTIHDRFLYKNKYKLFVFSQNKKAVFSIEKICFEPKRVYHGQVCDLISCEVNNIEIKRDTGPFKIDSIIMMRK